MTLPVETRIETPPHTVEINREAGKRVLLVQRELLGMEGLPNVHKSQLEDLFANSIIPTDGDTFVTFPSPHGGFLTVDQAKNGEVMVAWHERTHFERGKVEAIRVSFDGVMYREYEKVPPHATIPGRDIFTVGNDSLSHVDSFRARRLRGEIP